jgi:hypothetical protein
MKLLDSILSASNGGVVKQLADQFAITPAQAASATSALLPALAAGLQQKLGSGDAIALSTVISNRNLVKFVNDPTSLGTTPALDQGNSLLKQIFANGDLGNVPTLVAEKAGISSSIVTRMLPIVATLLVAYLAKNANSEQGDLEERLDEVASAGHGGILSAVKGLSEKVLG